LCSKVKNKKRKEKEEVLFFYFLFGFEQGRRRFGVLKWHDFLNAVLLTVVNKQA
jgi:hypothetical protein